MLNDLQNNVISAIVLVMIVIVAALGVRSSLLVGLAIRLLSLPVSRCSIKLGYTMNIVVLFSLILVVGMLVDGTIVVTELANRNLGEGWELPVPFPRQLNAWHGRSSLPPQRPLRFYSPRSLARHCG